jgi:excisionase family DNA binding protein
MSGEKQSGQCKTITVPEAGARYFGLKRDASYAAAARGDLPTIRIGRTLRVPVAAMERMLEQAPIGRKDGAA